MDFNDNYPSYEMMAHHSEEEGKVKRKKLWKVFWIMLAVTIVELIIGFYQEDWGLTDAMRYSTVTLKFIFIILTIVKAAYIVLSFMHLGDEKKVLKYTILVPYIFFVLYLSWIVITEGTYSGADERKAPMNELIIEEQNKIRTGGGAHHGGNDHHENAAAGAESGDKHEEGEHHEKKEAEHDDD